MVRQAGRKPQPASSDTPWIAAGGIIAVLAVIGLIVWVGAAADPGVRQAAGGANPIALLQAFANGTASVGGIQVAITLGLAMLFLGLGVLIAVAWARNEKGRSRVDHNVSPLV